MDIEREKELYSQIEGLRSKIEGLWFEIDRLRITLKPFADAVFNDNGEMTITYNHGPQAYYDAYFALKTWNKIAAKYD